MLALPTHAREEWTDADFDLPEGDAIIISNPDVDRESDNWDFELQEEAASTIKPSRSSINQCSPDDSGDIPTIKATGTSSLAPLEENIEDAFSLPPGLSRLSLPPLNHRVSRTSFDWVDRDHTASSSTTSLSSDTFTSFGLNPGVSPSTSSHSTPGTKPESRPDDDLEGLILPSTIFDSTSAAKHLTRILETKRSIPASRPSSGKEKAQEQDLNFEDGLVINNDLDFSPGRLPKNRLRREGQTPTHRKLTSKTSVSPKSSHDRPWSPFKYNQASVRSSSPVVKFPGRGLSPDSTLTPQTSNARLSSQVRSQASLISIQATGPRRKLKRKVSLPSFHSSLGKVASEISAPGPEAITSYTASTVSSRSKIHFRNTLRSSQRDVNLPDASQTSRATNYSSTGSNLTLPSSFNRSRIRPALSSIFSISSSSPPSSRTSSPPSTHTHTTKFTETRSTRSPVGSCGSVSTSSQVLVPTNALMRKPKRHRFYGDGTELDGIEDLQIDRDQERRFRVLPQQTTYRIPGGSYSQSIHKALFTRFQPQPVEPDSIIDPADCRSHGTISRKESRHAMGRKKPTLIRNLNGLGGSKVIGEMRWNPHSLKWDGNEQALRDFDVVNGNSTRPALITHLTGSTNGNALAGISSGVRIVGNMMFDPEKMCWLPKESSGPEEPDPFAGIDEEDGYLVPRQSIDIPASSVSSTDPSSSVSESEGESTNSRMLPQLPSSSSDPSFKDCCFNAAASHRQEISGWVVSNAGLRSRLNYIRDLATKQY